MMMHFYLTLSCTMAIASAKCKVKGENMNTLSEIMFIAVIHNRIAWQCVLDVGFIKGLSLTTGNIIEMC